jgi:hypothetical protein
LEEVAGKYDCRIHSYVLMTNHVAVPAHPCAHGTCLSINIAYVNNTYGRSWYFTDDASIGAEICFLRQ